MPKGPLNDTTPDAIPLVIVEGFMSASGSIGWAPLRSLLSGFEEYLDGRQVLYASVGPVSSLHDRACELFYAIKGGTVDYGEDHAREFSHKRYGRHHHSGLYPDWSPRKPLHFLGHSMGGATIVKLQSLLSKGFFGNAYTPDMLLSITTVSAPFRGTQIVYTFGERLDRAPAVHPFSLGSLLAKAVHTLAYLSPYLPRAFDLHADSRSLSCNETSFLAFLRHLWRSDWAEGRDATPFDVTFQAADEREARGEGVCHPKTYYRSYTAQITSRISEESLHHEPRSILLSLPPLYFSASSVGTFDFTSLSPSPSFLLPPVLDEEGGRNLKQADDGISEHHRANDGFVPTFSQWHPRECEPSHCIHHSSFPEKTHSAHVLPGVWHVHTLHDAHHLSLLPFWLGSEQQRVFWSELREYMRDIDLDTGVDLHSIV